MATIRKREGTRGVRWHVQVRMKGHTRTASFERKTDAKQWARETETELGKGRSVPTREALKRTLGEAIDRYLEEVLPTKARNRDRVNRERHLKWWKEQLGDWRLRELTPDSIVRTRDQVRARLHATGQSARDRHGQPIPGLTVPSVDHCAEAVALDRRESGI